jgi:hypothetical protein
MAGPKIKKHRQIADGGDRMKPPDKRYLFLAFLARKFQLAWNNAATTTMTRARLLIKVAPDDLPPQ